MNRRTDVANSWERRPAPESGRRRLVWTLIVPVFLAAAGAPAAAAPNDVRYRAQMRSAQRHLMRGNAVEAVGIYADMLKNNPGDEPAASGYVEALLQLERYDDAEAFLEETLPTVEPKTNLYRKRVTLRRLQGKPGDAFADVLHVMSENAELASWSFQTTRDLLGEGLVPATASRASRRAYEDHPGNADFAVLTAVILALDERTDEARALMVEIDDQKKQFGQLIKRYSDEMLALGRREVALEGFLLAAEKAVKSSRRTQFLFAATDLLEEDGRYRDALAHLATVAEERGGSSAAGKALIRSAQIYQRHLDDPEGALQVYEKLEHDPSLGHYRPEMLLQMGNCYVKLGRFDRATEVFRSVIPEALDPEHAESAAYRLAEVAFYTGRAEEALELYQDMAETYARSLLTDEAAGRYILLNTYSTLGGGEAVGLLGRTEWARSVGDSALADSCAQELIRRYPEGELAAEAWLARGELALERDDPQTALDRFEKVVTGHAADRRAPVALKRQGEIYMSLGRNDEALARFERILADYPQSVLAGEVRRHVQQLRQSL
jgi:tetratricopeptide (TPR) repeat protein